MSINPVLRSEELGPLAVEFLWAFSQDRITLRDYVARAQGSYAFDYPDDDLPSWDNEVTASRAFVLSAFRVLHRYSFHAADVAWIEEFRGIQTIIEYMIACRENEYFWYLEKEKPAYVDEDGSEIRVEQGPLDFGWDLLGYLARLALEKVEEIGPTVPRDLIDLVSSVGVAVSHRAPLKHGQ